MVFALRTLVASVVAQATLGVGHRRSGFLRYYRAAVPSNGAAMRQALVDSNGKKCQKGKYSTNFGLLSRGSREIAVEMGGEKTLEAALESFYCRPGATIRDVKIWIESQKIVIETQERMSRTLQHLFHVDSNDLVPLADEAVLNEVAPGQEKLNLRLSSAQIPQQYLDCTNRDWPLWLPLKNYVRRDEVEVKVLSDDSAHYDDSAHWLRVDRNDRNGLVRFTNDGDRLFSNSECLYSAAAHITGEYDTDEVRGSPSWRKMQLTDVIEVEDQDLTKQQLVCLEVSVSVRGDKHKFCLKLTSQYDSKSTPHAVLVTGLIKL